MNFSKHVFGALLLLNGLLANEALILSAKASLIDEKRILLAQASSESSGMETPQYATEESQQSPGMETPQYASTPGTSTNAGTGTGTGTGTDTSQGQSASDPADAAAEAQFSGDLSSLEDKFFHHDYAGDSIQTRLERVERIVYGSAKSGSVQDRITQLLIDVPNLASANTSSPSLVQPQAASQEAQEAPSAPGAIQGPQNPPSLKAEVSSMETQIYGKTFPDDSLNNRVTRLEQTVFASQPTQTFLPIQNRIGKLVATLQPQFAHPQNLYTDSPVLASSKKSSKSDSDQEKHGHPFLKKLEHTLGRTAMVAGSMVGSMAMSSMMGGYGMGGLGGGYGGYGGGYPGYAGYGNAGYGGYGYGGYGGYGGTRW